MIAPKYSRLVVALGNLGMDYIYWPPRPEYMRWQYAPELFTHGHVRPST